jgi:hypothetical protein
MSTQMSFLGRFFWGLILILVGVLFSSTRWGASTSGEIVSLVAGGFILIGLSILIGNRLDAGGAFFRPVRRLFPF